MRSMISAMLLASALAMPALAQDHGRGGEHPGGGGGGGQHQGWNGGGGHGGGDHGGGGGGWQGRPQGGGAPQPQPQQAPRPQPQRQQPAQAHQGWQGNNGGGGHWDGRGGPGGWQQPQGRPAPANWGGDHGRPDAGRPGWNGGQRPDWNGRPGGDWNHGRPGGGPGWNGGRPGPGGGNWNRGWRDDHRYDWRGWRDGHRGLYHLDRYRPPYGYGWGYRRFGVGARLDAVLFASDYWISDPWDYRLPPAYGPYRWVRYYNDALLVDIQSGFVVDEIPDFFW